MRILMLDKNQMIDRRIILEANSLRKNGHEVTIFASTAYSNFSEECLNDITLLRFSHSYFDSDFEEYKNINIYQRMIENNFTRQDFFSNKKLIKKLRFLNAKYKINSLLKSRALRKLILYSLYPSEGAKELNSVNIPLKFKLLLKIYLAVISFSPKNLSIAVREFFSQFTNNHHQDNKFIDTLNLTNKAIKRNLKKSLESHHLDYWERSVLKYILTSNLIPDAIHAHDLPALKLGVVLSKCLSIPLIYDAHELYSYQPGIPSYMRNTLLTQEKELIQFCTNTIVINKQQAEIMAKDFDFHNFTIATNATTIPDGFDVENEYDLIRKKLKLASSEKILLFQGGINKERKIDLLLQGLQLTPSSIHMVFLTFGAEISYFKALTKSLKINERVHFLPTVHWDEILFWAASADGGIMPYQADDMNTRISSPNKLYEFIAAGTPVIGSSELINVKAIVESEGFGVLKKLHRPADYAEAINEFFDESKGGPKRFREALLKNRHKYLWSHEEGRIISLYEQIELKQKQNAVSLS